MKLEYYHYTDFPVARFTSYAQGEGDSFMKPRGVWLSVEGLPNDINWRDWCLSERLRLERLRFRHRVELKPGAQLLHLSGAYEIDAFTREYDITPPRIMRSGYFIDWPRVAQRYQGIAIAPYCWARRLEGHCFWYYSWDCSSACVWDADAFASVQLCAPAPALPPRRALVPVQPLPAVLSFERRASTEE